MLQNHHLLADKSDILSPTITLWLMLRNHHLLADKSDILSSNLRLMLPNHLSLANKSDILSSAIATTRLMIRNSSLLADKSENLSLPSRNFVPGRRNPACHFGRTRCPSSLMRFQRFLPLCAALAVSLSALWAGNPHYPDDKPVSLVRCHLFVQIWTSRQIFTLHRSLFSIPSHQPRISLLIASCAR